MKNKGLFITVEGIEGVGKSTAVEYLKEHLLKAGYDVVQTREPGGTALAEVIRNIVLKDNSLAISADAELLLIFAARVQHLAEVIVPALTAGKCVLSDRFTDASYAYQGGGRGVNVEKISALETCFQGGMRPDLTILLDAPVEVGLARVKQRGELDRIEQEKNSFFTAVRDTYLNLAQENPQRYRVVDASQEMLEVRQQLIHILNELLSKQAVSTNSC